MMYLDPIYTDIKDRQKRYESEAKVWRQLPKTSLAKKLAWFMRKLADRLEPQTVYSQVLTERTY
jgi:hypothetical protein